MSRKVHIEENKGGQKRKARKKKKDDLSASDTLSAVPMFLQVAPQEGSCSSEDGLGRVGSLWERHLGQNI